MKTFQSKQAGFEPTSCSSENCKAETESFFSRAEGASFHANSFTELNLSRPLLLACKELGYKRPTPIQAACIPLALAGRDICGSAITGSGKTAAFALPTLERLLFRPKRILATRVLVLVPTRELAAQVFSMIQNLAQHTDIRCCVVVGGLALEEQKSALRSKPDIVVATPGRILDHLRNSMSVDLDDLAVLILDEADRLLELGFRAEISELVCMCPKRCQTLLFSATMTEEVDELIKLSMTNPVRLSADPFAKRPEALVEEVITICGLHEVNQEAVLLALCSKTFSSKVIIFSGTKQTAHRLKILFDLTGLKAAELHRNLTQVQRLDAIDHFRKQVVDFLIATDIASRGLDIIGVQTVINYTCPRDLKTYMHRVGRTARAGKEGRALTFMTDNDRFLIKSIAKKAGSKLKNRIVAEQSIKKWSKRIEDIESQISAILQAEKEERFLKKAEMEAKKAENMIAHMEEIFSRPKRTWFVTERQKKLIAKAAKDTVMADGKGGEVVSAQQAEKLKIQEKKKRDHEKLLPRKKRRKLEAVREMVKNKSEIDKPKNKGSGRERTGKLLVDVGHQHAKTAKKATKSGTKVQKASNNLKHAASRNQSRAEEMQQLFSSDMSEKRLKKVVKKSKSSFKSKSRYKRR